MATVIDTCAVTDPIRTSAGIRSSLEHLRPLVGAGGYSTADQAGEGDIEDKSGQITYSLYLTYLDEIEELQSLQRNVGETQESLVEELLQANAKLDTIERSLHHRELTSVDVHKQIFEDEDAMDYMENTYQEELRVLRAENEEIMLLKTRVLARITDTTAEAEGLKTLTNNIESKLLQVQDELDKLKAVKTAYEETTLREKEEMKLQVRKLTEKNKDLSKAVDSITTEIAAKSKTQKHLEVTLQKTKEELRSLAKQFSKKQEKEEAKAINRKASLYEGVIAGGAPTGEVTLVFSSVDGSKELWEMFPMAMTLAIDMHNNILKNRIKRAGGYEVKSDGDSFMVAFSDVLTGLQYCMLVQEDLLGATWPQEILSSQYAAEKLSLDGRVLFCGLRCRMGLHVGKPQCRPNPVTGRMDYLGSMVNKAARVAGLAIGGQVFASDAAVKHLFEIKDENCKVYLSQLGIRTVGTFPLRGIQGEEKITEILPHTLRDRQFLPVGSDILPQSPMTNNTNNKDVPNNQATEASEIGEHETPGAQFAKFAEIPEPPPQIPVVESSQPAPSPIPLHVPLNAIHPLTTSQILVNASQLPLTTSQIPLNAPQIPLNAPQIPLNAPQIPLNAPQIPLNAPQIPPNATHLPLLQVASQQAQLSVTIPSPSDTPIPSPSTGGFLDSMASMEYLTNSLLTSMNTSSPFIPAQTVNNTTGPFPFNSSQIISHPDDAIQKKYEEKLKAAEEHLILIKSDLARVKTDKDNFREKLKSLKEKEKALKTKYTQEANKAQERQQDLAKMAFEKLHTSQLLEKANLNISNICILLKNLEEKIAISTTSRDHAKNAYHHWDQMMKLMDNDILAHAKKSTQLEAEWAGLRNAKIAYFTSAKGLEAKIEQVLTSNPTLSTEPSSSTPSALWITKLIDYRAAESDVLMMDLLFKEKLLENDTAKMYIQQLTAAIANAEDTHNRSTATTKELSEKTTLQESQLQRILMEKRQQAQELQDFQKSYLQDVNQMLRVIKQSQTEVFGELKKTQEVKATFGSAVADKYQEVVQHLQTLENNQKLAKEKEKRSSMNRSLSVARSLHSSSGSDKDGFTTLDKSRGSGYHSSFSLLDSGSSMRGKEGGLSRSRGNRSPTERDGPASIRSAKLYSSTTALLGAKNERGNHDTGTFHESKEGNPPNDGSFQSRRSATVCSSSTTTAPVDERIDGGNLADKGFDFRSIALVQNELANRLADAKQLEPSNLDLTRDQMATLSRLMKGTRSEEADLSIIGTGVDGPSIMENKPQRLSLSMLQLAMQIKPEAYHRRGHNPHRSMEDLKVSGQKLLG